MGIPARPGRCAPGPRVRGTVVRAGGIRCRGTGIAPTGAAGARPGRSPRAGRPFGWQAVAGRPRGSPASGVPGGPVTRDPVRDQGGFVVRIGYGSGGAERRGRPVTRPPGATRTVERTPPATGHAHRV